MVAFVLIVKTALVVDIIVLHRAAAAGHVAIAAMPGQMLRVVGHHGAAHDAALSLFVAQLSAPVVSITPNDGCCDFMWRSTLAK